MGLGILEDRVMDHVPGMLFLSFIPVQRASKGPDNLKMKCTCLDSNKFRLTVFSRHDPLLR